MAAHRITRVQLEKAGACSLEAFESSPRRQGDELLFEEGWTREEALRIAQRGETLLRFLVAAKLVPMTDEEMRSVILEARPKPAAHRSMAERFLSPTARS